MNTLTRFLRSSAQLVMVTMTTALPISVSDISSETVVRCTMIGNVQFVLSPCEETFNSSGSNNAVAVDVLFASTIASVPRRKDVFV